MRTMHLFAGAGGGLLADLILGHEPVCAVEWDAYCCVVLRERAADGWFPGLHVHEGDVRLFDPSPWAGRVDCIAAGFPCQDISAAGSGAGINGERSGLYREVLRVADVVRPGFILLENSPAITGRGLDRVLGDLAARGYDARWTVLAAADVGAPHLRERWWCLAWRADSEGVGWREGWTEPGAARQAVVGEHCGALANANEIGGEIGRHIRQWSTDIIDRGGMGDANGLRQLQPEGREPVIGGRSSDSGWWIAEPAVGRVAHGVASRVDQIAALGNGQVPLCAAAAWRILGGP